MYEYIGKFIQACREFGVCPVLPSARENVNMKESVHGMVEGEEGEARGDLDKHKDEG